MESTLSYPFITGQFSLSYPFVLVSDHPSSEKAAYKANWWLYGFENSREVVQYLFRVSVSSYTRKKYNFSMNHGIRSKSLEKMAEHSGWHIRELHIQLKMKPVTHGVAWNESGRHGAYQLLVKGVQILCSNVDMQSMRHQRTERCHMHEVQKYFLAKSGGMF
ncbi:hypothetical protein B0H17DRAFT_1146539 [Mycena rosella]|uniref:Uncharacterized protein n=1 Tax=Mycena rosella TaxID=1033263 RepID=A0AAD7CNU2_MYCRO|nr:hypothetical protein B0H17DRAFT_1146539 [Mycena rosella]